MTTPATTLDKALPLLKWTLDMYHAATNAGVFEDHRVELLNGNIVEREMPDPIHEWLIEALRAYLEEMLGDLVKVREGKPLTLPDDSEPIPDVSVVKDQDYRSRHPSPEDVYLVIEVANSNPTRDTKTKRATYARAGIPEYWVFDLEQQKLRVFRDIQGEGDTVDYQVDVAWSRNTIQIGAFPNVELSARQLRRWAFELD